GRLSRVSAPDLLTDGSAECYIGYAEKARHGHAGTTACDEAVLGDSSGKRCELHGAPRPGDGLPGAEWVGQVDDDEDDHGADRAVGGRDSVRWPADRGGPDRVQAAHGVRAGGAASLQPSLRRRVPDDGGAAAGSGAG